MDSFSLQKNVHYYQIDVVGTDDDLQYRWANSSRIFLATGKVKWIQWKSFLARIVVEWKTFHNINQYQCQSDILETFCFGDTALLCLGFNYLPK